MATSVRLRVIDIEKGHPYEGKVLDGVTSILNIPSDKEHMEVRANISLQSFETMVIDRPCDLFMMIMCGKTLLETRKFLATKVTITREDKRHILSAIIKKVNLRDYFGSFHEAAT